MAICSPSRHKVRGLISIKQIFNSVINQYIFIIYYTNIWKRWFKEHIKKCKKENPEMDDFEKEIKLWF